MNEPEWLTKARAEGRILSETHGCEVAASIRDRFNEIVAEKRSRELLALQKTRPKEVHFQQQVIDHARCRCMMCGAIDRRDSDEGSRRDQAAR